MSSHLLILVAALSFSQFVTYAEGANIQNCSAVEHPALISGCEHVCGEKNSCQHVTVESSSDSDQEDFPVCHCSRQIKEASDDDPSHSHKCVSDPKCAKKCENLLAAIFSSSSESASNLSSGNSSTSSDNVPRDFSPYYCIMDTAEVCACVPVSQPKDYNYDFGFGVLFPGRR